jgi:hypothetical protein
VLLVVTTIALVGVSALALNVPNTFVAGEVISATQMNANFAAVEVAVTALEVQVAELGAVDVDALRTAVANLESQLGALAAAQPVVAHAKRNFAASITGMTTNAMDLVVVDITVPAEGVVVVEAAAQTAYYDTTNANWAALRLDSEPGGTIPYIGTESYVFGASLPPNIGVVYGFAALRRTFTVQAGIHTFRLKGFDLSGTGAKYVYNPSITATWYPASQATVPAYTATLTHDGSGSTQDR